VYVYNYSSNFGKEKWFSPLFCVYEEKHEWSIFSVSPSESLIIETFILGKNKGNLRFNN
jgi:hypothetical protein